MPPALLSVKYTIAHISLLTRQHDKFTAILANSEAFKLFDRGYETEGAARTAEKRIRELV